MHRLYTCWLVHWFATVAGWYTLSAFAQGVADSTAATPLPLVVFNVIMQLLCFPAVLAAVRLLPWLGGFGYLSFAAFTLLAALNSALVITVVAFIVRAVRRRRSPSQ